jgi:hypothetical protein
MNNEDNQNLEVKCEPKDIYCSACGKLMTYTPKSQEPRTEGLVWGVEGTYIALCISTNPSANPEYQAYLQKMFGPYEVGKQYCFCHECCFRALEVKP